MPLFFAGLHLALFAVLAPIFAFVAMVHWFLYSMTVEISGQELRWYFGRGFWRKRIVLSEIACVERVRLPWWYGIGIKYTRELGFIWSPPERASRFAPPTARLCASAPTTQSGLWAHSLAADIVAVHLVNLAAEAELPGASGPARRRRFRPGFRGRSSYSGIASNVSICRLSRTTIFSAKRAPSRVSTTTRSS